MNQLLIEKSNLISKKYLLEKADIIKKAIQEEGLLDPLEVYKMITAYEKMFKDIKEAILGNAIDEAEKYHKDELNSGFVNVSVSNTGTTLNLNDYAPRKKLYEELKALDEKLKIAFKSDDHIVTKEGEILPKVSIKKQSRKTIKVTIK